MSSPYPPTYSLRNPLNTYLAFLPRIEFCAGK
jgi:hypothetical protein